MGGGQFAHQGEEVRGVESLFGIGDPACERYAFGFDELAGVAVVIRIAPTEPFCDAAVCCQDVVGICAQSALGDVAREWLRRGARGFGEFRVADPTASGKLLKDAEYEGPVESCSV